MRLRFLFFLLTLVMSSGLHATTRYITQAGSGTQTGLSVANSISLASSMATVSPGDELRYMGAFTASIHITVTNVVAMACDSNGNFAKNLATVTGSAGTHAIYTDDNVNFVTILGFHVLSAYIDGIKNNGHYCTNKWNWVEKAGRGDPSWNTSGTYRGNGIAFHNKIGFHIEGNLVENCGAYPTQDHGMYGNGTNGVVRGNICRTNIAWGIQCADVNGDNDNVVIEENIVHDNGYTGTSQSGIVFQTHALKTNNKIRNNTVVARTGKYGIISYADNASSRLTVKNNSITADSGYGIIVPGGGSSTNTVISDYNLKSAIVSSEPQGANDVAGTALFDSEASARYWPSPTSPARMIALSTECPTVDFFGRVQSKVYDVGAVQFEDMLANDDNRQLGDGARDPWVREPYGVVVVPSPTSHEIRWTEPDAQAVSYTIQRKDSVGGTYAILAEVNRGIGYYLDPVSAMTNGLTYTYLLSPTTTLGNQGGIHSPAVAVVCDKLSTIHPNRLFSWGTNVTGLKHGVVPTYSTASWSDITVSIPGTNIVAVADDVTDNADAFDAAWLLAPSNTVIGLPAGHFAIGRTPNFAIQSLSANNNKVFRGAGTNLTTISILPGFVGSSVFKLGAFNEQGTERIISTSLAKGATQLTLPGGLGAIPIRAGSLVKIWEDDSSGMFGGSGTGGNADPNYYSADGSTYSIAAAPLKRDLVVCTSTNGSTVVNFWPPLGRAYSAGAKVQYQYLYMCNFSGIEGMKIDNSVAQVSRIIDIEGTYQCWIKDVMTCKAAASHVRAQYNVNFMIEGCRFYDATAFTANAGIGIQLLRDCDSGVIRNNIIEKVYPAIEFQNSADYNVMSGNVYINPQGGLAPIDNHGGFNEFNLFENEVGYGVVLDGYFGAAANWTFNRCRFTGDASTFGARKIMNFDRFSRYINVVDSVLGNSQTNWDREITTNGWQNSWASLYRFGYPNMGNDTYTLTNGTFVATNISGLDIGVKSNIFLHGNYEFTSTPSTNYHSSVTNRVFAKSLFNEWNSSSAPAWWNGADWPVIGSDLATKTNSNPAFNYYYRIGIFGATPAPLISSVASSSVTQTAATITWTTDQAASARVTYNSVLSTNDANLETSHAIYLTGLSASTTYTYSCTSSNVNGSTTSSDYQFTTLPLSPPPPPPIDETVVAAVPTNPVFTLGSQPASSGSSPLKFAEDSSFMDLLPKPN